MGVISPVERSVRRNWSPLCGSMLGIPTNNAAGSSPTSECHQSAGPDNQRHLHGRCSVGEDDSPRQGADRDSRWSRDHGGRSMACREGASRREHEGRGGRNRCRREARGVFGIGCTAMQAEIEHAVLRRVRETESCPAMEAPVEHVARLRLGEINDCSLGANMAKTRETTARVDQESANVEKRVHGVVTGIRADAPQHVVILYGTVVAGVRCRSELAVDSGFKMAI